MVILGIDPGTARLGYGLVRKEGGRVFHITHGCIETPSGLDQPERLLLLHERLGEIMAAHGPELTGVERLYFAKNAKTAMAVSEARGVVLLRARMHGQRIIEQTPMQIKQAVCGYGGAGKRQVQEMIARLMGLDGIPKPDDAADALAVAYGAAVSEALLKKMTA